MRRFHEAMRLRVIPIVCLVLATATVLVWTAGASGGRLAPAASAARTKPPAKSPDLWATINVCDTVLHPDTIGVRGSMPGVGARRGAVDALQGPVLLDPGRRQVARGRRQTPTRAGSASAARARSSRPARTSRSSRPTAGGAHRLRGVVQLQVDARAPGTCSSSSASRRPATARRRAPTPRATARRSATSRDDRARGEQPRVVGDDAARRPARRTGGCARGARRRSRRTSSPPASRTAAHQARRHEAPEDHDRVAAAGAQRAAARPGSTTARRRIARTAGIFHSGDSV